MSGLVLGRLDWKSQATREGHRTHTIKWLVQSAYQDDPYAIYFAAGLPSVGSPWSFGTVPDMWAFCEPDWSVNQVLIGEPNDLWTVEQRFSTRPRKRCQDTSIEDPLSEPDRLSGSFIKFTKEATKDRHGTPLTNSAKQPIRGKLAERESNRPTVRIERNVSTLDLGQLASMVDCVNDATLWGLGPRKVKLAQAPWTRQTYGTCNHYFTITYDFDIEYNGFDIKAQDSGTAVLSEGGDPTNPADFEIYKDQKGEQMEVLLDGSGNIWDGVGDPGEIDIEHYDEANFLLLGIPSTIP